jgi:hypothetical protein
VGRSEVCSEAVEGEFYIIFCVQNSTCDKGEFVAVIEGRSEAVIKGES